VQRLRDAEIPVMGHIGLTPQSVNRFGGFKVQGKSLSAIEQLMRDAIALEGAGVFAVVLEGIPREVAAMITAQLSVPTIGIGAGPDCDGQVLVLHDLVGLTFSPPAKFVRKYADVRGVIAGAIREFKQDVETGAYPGEDESYHLPREVAESLESVTARRRSR
jgi:3-methyl-2-oxobutanoate hydroxymethyltransferase